MGESGLSYAETDRMRPRELGRYPVDLGHYRPVVLGGGGGLVDSEKSNDDLVNSIECEKPCRRFSAF